MVVASVLSLVREQLLTGEQAHAQYSCVHCHLP